MARPSYRENQLTAKERLKEAFWLLLSEHRYSQITVKKLSQAAQVNPNTFYYHYDSLDELALDALNDEKLYEIPSIIHEKFLSADQTALREALGYVVIGDRWKRIRMFVNSDSTILRQHLYDMMEQFWLSLIGIQEEALSGDDLQDLSFILHGAMAIIEQQKAQYSFDFINALPDRPLGQGILRTLETLVMKYQRKS